MGVFLFILYSLICLAIIYWWKFFNIKGVKNIYLILIFVLKLTFGIGLSLIYSNHYQDRATGDTYRFFDDARIMHSSLDSGIDTYLCLLTGIGLEENEEAQIYYLRMTHMEREYYTGFPNDNATIIKANALALHLSRGYYQIHIVIWCFLSMIGLTALFKSLMPFFPRKTWAIFLSVYLLPTVLFWGSGVLKEPILLLGIGLFVSSFIKLIYGSLKWGRILGLLLGLLILIFTKGYVLICMIPAIAGLILVKISKGRKFWLWFSLPHALILILLFVGPYLGNTFKIAELMKLKQEAFYNVAELSQSGSVVELPEIKGPASIIYNAPQALVISYLRPWPWELDKVLYIPAAIENLFLLIALALMVWNFRRPYGMNLPILAFCASFVLCLGIIMGEVVPVLGAIVRYKMPALIFLFILVFGLTDHAKLQRRLPIFRKLIRKL